MASLKYKDEFVAALLKEIDLQKKYLNNEPIETIYLGGGTPSLLSSDDLKRIFDRLYKTFIIDPEAEITIEANPDDIEKPKINTLAKLSINRLSLGVQSFFKDDLEYLNRSHSDQQAYNSVLELQDAGFQNISIDLIFGIPTLIESKWEKNLSKFKELNIPHLSAYALTVEPKTALDLFIKNKKYEALDELKSVKQFEFLMDWAADNNFLHYEISNYCKEGYYSNHNTNYWKQEKYLGLGPSAHSYNHKSRQWNISNVRRYIESISKGSKLFEIEQLDNNMKLNEYIMVSLRTMWGLDLGFIENKYGESIRQNIENTAKQFVKNNEVVKKGDFLILSQKGKLVADGIASEMFM